MGTKLKKVREVKQMAAFVSATPGRVGEPREALPGPGGSVCSRAPSGPPSGSRADRASRGVLILSEVGLGRSEDHEGVGNNLG